MKDEFLISVIIPVYNTDKYLSDCIDSVLSQTYRNLEIILIDDGSIDRSGDICDEYAKNDSRIVVIHQNNSGVSISRNKGIKISKGKYIAFIDSDDCISKIYIELLMRYMTIDGMCVCKLTNDNNLVMHTINEKTKIIKYTPHNAMINMATPPVGMVCGPHCRLFSKKIIMDNSIEFNQDIAIGEDYLFNSKYLSVCTGQVYEIDAKLYYLRPNSGVSVNRFYKNTVNKRQISAYKAMKLSAECFDDTEIRHLLALRACKAASDDLRLMTTSNCSNSGIKKELQCHIRKYLFPFLLSKYPISSKISVFLAAISPKIECLVWRLMKKTSK